ncbi:MAG: TetR/AcrR family transcriptional regulator [Steroidobacteraceae bacterium]
MQRTDDDDAVVQRILNGAAQCFRGTGLRKTSMLDIAEAAGVGRQTVYRRFANKEAIIESLFEHRVRTLLESMTNRSRAAVDIEDLIIDTSLEWVQLTQRDLVLRAIIDDSDSHETELFLVGGRSVLQRIAEQIWDPILESARAAGSLRNLTNKQAVQYVRATHYLLHVRDDLKERERVEFVKHSLVTTLILDAKNKYAR